MPRFRKLPVEIEAEQFWPDKKPWPEGVEHDFPEPAFAGGEPFPKEYYIKTLEGRHEVTPGDWIITGVSGERYLCKPNIFEETYEPV